MKTYIQARNSKYTLDQSCSIALFIILLIINKIFLLVTKMFKIDAAFKDFHSQSDPREISYKKLTCETHKTTDPWISSTNNKIIASYFHYVKFFKDLEQIKVLCLYDVTSDVKA